MFHKVAKLRWKKNLRETRVLKTWVSQKKRKSKKPNWSSSSLPLPTTKTQQQNQTSTQQIETKNIPLSPWTTTNSENSQYLNPLKIHKTKTQTHKKFTIPKPTMALIKFGSCPTSTTTTTTRSATQNYEQRERQARTNGERKKKKSVM